MGGEGRVREERGGESRGKGRRGTGKGKDGEERGQGRPNAWPPRTIFLAQALAAPPSGVMNLL